MGSSAVARRSPGTIFQVSLGILAAGILSDWGASEGHSQEIAKYRANVSFLQGDAFFHSWLRADLCNEIEAGEGDLELRYGGPALSGTFGDFAGYSSIRISDVGSETRRGIAMSYRKFREINRRSLLEIVDRDGNVALKETNPLNLFIYPNSADFLRQRIGIKYNGAWRDLQYPVKGLGDVDLPPRRAPAYVSFVQSDSAILEDWGNAGVYPSLEVAPQSDTYEPLIFGAESHEIVSVPSCKVKFVILFDSEIEDFFARREDCRWIEISDSAEIAVKYFSKSHLAVTDVEASLELNRELRGTSESGCLSGF